MLATCPLSAFLPDSSTQCWLYRFCALHIKFRHLLFCSMHLIVFCFSPHQQIVRLVVAKKCEIKPIDLCQPAL